MKETFVAKKEYKVVEDMVKALERGYSDAMDIANGKFSNEELIEYAKELVKRINFKKPEIYFWSLGVRDGMPADVRVDFIYKPTYLASSIIMHAVVKNPELMDDPEISGCLPYILNGCIGRDFYGHGYESDEGLVETLEIFSILDTYEFVSKYPKVNSAFSARFKRALMELKKLAEMTDEEFDSLWSDFNRDLAKRLNDYYDNIKKKTREEKYRRYVNVE